MADITLYDRATLDAVYRYQKVPSNPFWLPMFGRQINFDTPEVMFDRVYGDDRGLAPFVLPNVKGRPQQLGSYDTLRFRPAYVKIKDVVSPEMAIERLPGEQPITGALSIGQRIDAVKAELLRKAKIKIQNRLEWLAARAIIDGSVVISGEEYPAVTVDFRRDASLSYTLTGGAKWDQSTADPLADMMNLRVNANNRSGTRMSKYVFGGDAWVNFTKRVDLRDLMDRNFGGQASEVSLFRDGLEGQEYMGVIQGSNGQGRLELWVDTSKFIDPDTGAESFYLDQGTVVGVGAGFQGVRCFGAIMDKGAGYRPLDVFFKNWDEEDPSLEYILSQSAPLMVPKNPNTTGKIKVV